MSPALRVLFQNSSSFVAFRSFGSSQTSLKALRLTSFEAKTEIGFECPRALEMYVRVLLLSHWREMTALALSVLRGIVENDLNMEKVYFYLPQVHCAFWNIFFSILRRSPVSRQRLIICN